MDSTPPQPDRLAILRRLEWRPRSSIPFIPQVGTTDCGAACLAMALAYHGRQVSLEEVRTTMGVARDGASALVIADTAHRYDLRTQTVSLPIAQLSCLGPGSILFWGFDHYVVLDRVLRQGVRIVDPALGRRDVSLEEASRLFTGVAIVLTPGERFAPGGKVRSGLGRYLTTLMRHRGLLTQVLVASLLYQFLILAAPLATGLLVDRVIPRRDLHLLGVLALGFAGAALFAFLADLVRARFSLHLRTHLDIDLTVGFVEHLMALPYGFFQSRSAGDLLMRVNSSAVIREILASGAISSLLDGLLVNAYLILVFTSHFKLGLLVLGCALAQLVVFLIWRRRQRELMAQGLEVQSKAQSYQVEMLTCIETLKVLGAGDRAVDHWLSLFTDSQNVALRRGRLDALSGSLSSALRHASAVAVLFYGAILVLRGELTTGSMLALGTVATGLFTPLAGLLGTVSQVQLLASYVERIDDVMKLPVEAGAEPHLRLRLSGRIVADRISFAYGPRAPLTLKGIDLQVPAGQHLAIVGPSGSGKSTLAKVLVGLYPPGSGRILYDEFDLARFGVALRPQIGVVPQESQLFGVSVRDNIALGAPGSSLAEIIEAARLVGLHDQIREMPMGYDTVLADRGLSLSGGQRQRIALARALLRRPAILVLDEATSSLDSNSERDLFEVLNRLDCTRINIAHRLSTVRGADRIVVMEKGEIVESGCHEELVSRRGGRYAGLVDAQL